MNRYAKIFCKVTLLTLPVLCRGASGDLAVTAGPDGRITARNAAGAEVWQVRTSDPSVTVNPLPGGRFLLGNGTVLDSAGRVVARFPSHGLGTQVPSRPRAVVAQGSGPAWDPLTQLSADGAVTFTGPVMDSLGNAWIVFDDGVNLSVVESSGTSGTWQTPYILGPTIAAGGFGAAITVDQSGDVYVVYNNTQTGSTPLPLTWAKYSPASGWQAPAVAYNSPDNFGFVIPAITSSGQLVVVFNANGISSIVYDPATSSWGPVQNLVPASDQPLLPSMAANASGSRLALVYLGTRGLEYSFFDSSTAQWESPAAIPQSERATFSVDATDSFLPISVDSSGNVTVVTALSAGFRQYGVGGFRYEGSRWQLTELVSKSDSNANLENFGSIAQSPSGAVLVAVPTNYGAYAITVFRYTPGVGWDTETAASVSTSEATRCRIAWFASGEAVVVYFNNTIEDAAIYSNGAWASGPVIPGGYGTFYPGIATAPNGDVLLTMSSEAFESYGLVVTWLLP
jgi:hypothetical protein